MARKKDIFSYGAAEGAKSSPFSDIINLIDSFKEAEDKAEQRISSKRLNMIDHLGMANTTEELNNLSNIVSEYNEEANLYGLDEYSLKNVYNEKKEIFNAADLAYKEAENIYKENNFLTNNIKSTDDLYKKISSLNWEEMTREKSNLFKLKNKLEEAQKVPGGYKYTSSEGVTQVGILDAVNTRINQMDARMHVWKENEGKFMIFDEKGQMDERSREMYDEYMYDIMSGDVASFKAKYGKDITATKQKYQAQQNRFNQINYLREQAKAKTVDELMDDYVANFQLDEDATEEEKKQYQTILGGFQDIKNNRGGQAIIDEQYFINQLANSQENGMKYNAIYEILTGEKAEDNPTWLGFDKAQETNNLALKNQKKPSTTIVTEDKDDDEEIISDKKGVVTTRTTEGDVEHKLPMKVVEEEIEDAALVQNERGNWEKPTKTKEIPVLVNKGGKVTDEGKKYIFDKLWLKHSQDMPYRKLIKDIALEQGVPAKTIWNSYKESLNEYAEKEGVGKGEFVKRADGSYEFIPVGMRAKKEKGVSPEDLGLETPIPKGKEGYDEQVARQEFNWLKSEVNEPNIAKRWNDNPETYLSTIRSHIDNKLLVLEDKDDIMEIIEFGDMLKKSNIDLSKKGAFPGLKDEIKKLQDKIVSLLFKTKDMRTRASYARAIQKAFTWAKDVMPNFSAEGFGPAMGLTKRPKKETKAIPKELKNKFGDFIMQDIIVKPR